MRGLAPGGGEDAEEAGLLSGAAAGGVGRVVVGHTHLQFIRATGAGVELVNPGSVGLPWDGDPRAAYALVAADGTVELRRVAYDRERTLAALGALGEPWAAQVAAWVEQARFDARP
jgi:diadenosine tetraphosphatase ApaH/serine/threonine PP2A family protein phosphatase